MADELDISKIHNPFAHIKYKNNDEWYLFWLCEDPEFINDVKDMIHMAWEFNGQQIKSLEYRNWSEDKERKWNKQVNQITKKYHISEEELFIIYSGFDTSLSSPFTSIQLLENGELRVYIPSGISERQYRDAWKLIKSMLPKTKTQMRRPKSPKDTQLVYAISRARFKGLTFTTIHDSYLRGDLYAYDGGADDIYDTPDELIRYYNRNKPTR